jgi:type II secretory pathway predicted ATPase ExeA
MTTSGERSALRRPRTDYGALGLRGNPFPVAGLSSPQTPYPLLDATVHDDVQSFINETLDGREYGGLAILGEYGAGKTYALRYIETLLRTITTRPDAEEVLAVYLERPQTTVLALVAEVCTRIGRLRIRNLLLEMIFADLAVAAGSEQASERSRIVALGEAMRGSPSASLFSQPTSLEDLITPEAVMNPAATLDVLRASGRDPQALRGFATESLTGILGAPSDARSADVAAHLAAIALADSASADSLWESLLKGQLRLEGNRSLPLRGQELWSYVLRVLSRAGYAMVYWLLDEFEELGHQEMRPAQLRAFLADFRDLVDANLHGFAVVLSAKVVAWDIYRQVNPAFTGRFSRVIHLSPHSVADLTDLIGHRLEKVRDSGTDCHPFTPEAIEAIQRMSAGNARIAVEACHVLLWHAATTGKDRIDADMVERLKDINRAFFYARHGTV